MNWNLVHVIKGSSFNIIYICNSLNIMSISDSMIDVINELKSGKSKDLLIEEYAQSGVDVKQFIEKIECDSDDIVKAEFNPNEKKIERITLHMANDCNLRCKYCYAGGGTYNTPSGMLTKEYADEFIAFCLNNFDGIGEILFFGGEPFMNFKIMNYICFT